MKIKYNYEYKWKELIGLFTLHLDLSKPESEVETVKNTTFFVKGPNLI